MREVLGEALTQAQHLVAGEWAAIEALAEALLARETLRYAEVCQIVHAG